MKNLRFMLFALIILACTKEKSTLQTQSPEAQIVEALPKTDKENVIKSNQEILKGNTPLTADVDSTLSLKFEQVHLQVNVLDLFSERSLFDKTYKDTIEVLWGIGESLGTKAFTIKIADSLVSGVGISLQYLTSLSVSDDGAHLDLVDWLHFQSAWQRLEIQEGTFIIPTYSEEDYTKFPEVNQSQILDRVIEQTGNTDNKFTRRAKDCEDANTYPCSVNISEIRLKMTISLKDGIQKHKLIRIETPVGC